MPGAAAIGCPLGHKVRSTDASKCIHTVECIEGIVLHKLVQYNIVMIEPIDPTKGKWY